MRNTVRGNAWLANSGTRGGTVSDCDCGADLALIAPRLDAAPLPPDPTKLTKLTAPIRSPRTARRWADSKPDAATADEMPKGLFWVRFIGRCYENRSYKTSAGERGRHQRKRPSIAG